MAKKSPGPTTLTFRDLVLGADAETLRQALEARLRIDELIAERQAAYERIAALETQVEEVIGEPGVFPFPAPPLPVAGLDPKADSFFRAASASPSAPKRGPGRAASASASAAASATSSTDTDGSAEEEPSDDEAPETPDSASVHDENDEDDEQARR